jgi:hypothetical protein
MYLFVPFFRMMQETDSFKELAEDIKKRTDSDTLNR